MASKLVLLLLWLGGAWLQFQKFVKYRKSIVPPKDKESESDEQEIILLAQKGAKKY